MKKYNWKHLRHLCVLPVFAIALLTGLRGLDYGSHFDEHVLFKGAKQMFNSGLFLPRWYGYPTFSFYVALLPSLKYVASYQDELDANNVLQLGESYREGLPKNTLQGAPTLFHVLSTHVDSHEYLLNARAIALTISLLSIFWVYLAVWNWRKSWGESLLAASLLGFSWEMAYHARWFVPDSMMMQFVALTLMLLSYAHTRSDPRFWLKCAAAAAGLACGTKYTGGILLVPIIVSLLSYLKTWRLLFNNKNTVMLTTGILDIGPVLPFVIGGVIGYVLSLGHRDQYLAVITGCMVGALLAGLWKRQLRKNKSSPLTFKQQKSSELIFPLGYQLRFGTQIVFYFALAFIISNPASVLEPAKFIDFVVWQRQTYSSGGINAYAVLGQLDHLHRMIMYLAAVFFSKYTVIAIFFSIMSLIGIYCLRKEKTTLMILTIVVVIYVVYISNFQLMYVRNLQLLFPFLAILAAIGCGHIQGNIIRILDRRAVLPAVLFQYIWPVFLSILILINGIWISQAAESIHKYNTDPELFRYQQFDGLKQFIQAHPDRSFILSKGIKSTWAEYGYPEYPQVVSHFASGAYAIFYSLEALASHMPKSNRFNLLHIIPPGPYEANLDYYSTWGGGRNRIVIAPFPEILSEAGSIFRTTVKLDNASIESIANLNLPKDVPQRLNSLTNQEFESELELFTAVTDEIGSANAKMFWRIIWTFAKFSLKTD
jgi:4-amino-4-deoxy-L-arabinose transferase-like glycosyltransferase